MKYKTFRALSLVVVVLAGIAALGGVGLCIRHRDEVERARLEELHKQAEAERIANEAREAEQQKQAELDRAAAARRAAEDQAKLERLGPAALFVDAPGLTDSDKDVLAALVRPATDKIKDATAGKPHKVNVYADEPPKGQPKRWNRAKVDLDRDGKWDESWTIKSSSIEKKVATLDDEKYDRSFLLLRSSGWTSTDQEQRSPPPPTPPPASSAAGGLSPSDQAVLDLAARLPPQEKIKDATKGQAFKVNLYSDDGARWNRAKVDLDRDDKWDESWTWKTSDLKAPEKKIAPADDESYTETYVLSGGSWQKK